MEREFTDVPPGKLINQLLANRDGRRFRRRAVLTKGDGQWELVCCTVEQLLFDEKAAEVEGSKYYRQAVLYEDFLTEVDCLNFVEALQAGRAQFGNIELQRRHNPQWSTEQLPVNNDYMARAGHAVCLRFPRQRTGASEGSLLAADQPYYPDVESAARDWLPLRVYHGSGDARNDQIIFLLPEARAFIAEAAFAEEGQLKVIVAGTGVGTLSLAIKGAYWEEKAIRHIDGVVSGTTVVLAVPADADRLEYYLIDREGTVYDFHREERFSRLARDGSVLGVTRRALGDQVREACQHGEGLQVEFKPFVPPEQPLGSVSKRTKLREVVTTVVAFANTAGGHIYLGVDDDCTVVGIDQDLQIWAKNLVDVEIVDRYLGALKNRIKEAVHGEVTLHLECRVVNDARVVVIEVAPASIKPVSLQQDQYFYVRTGASNRKLPPDQWKGVLQSEAL
ncbi:AlbA family DNA-binding domain-containing protein [Ralstonia chuxiongensis]|uniref:AlbA family DNA-binding domain-containing protein n=1 Tax=Ralstonia chuxiongensis TaxID=2957504 RepID=UPI0028F557E7|nr:ATP-binding protein [Ralstonia chuxiongensis]CAJ0784731.1 hypothetical protein R8510_05295 [Ralstonia chuxiongensis]